MLIPCKPLSELTSSSVTNEFPFLLVELQAIDDCDLMETVCGSTKKRARESLSNTENPKGERKQVPIPRISKNGHNINQSITQECFVSCST